MSLFGIEEAEALRGLASCYSCMAGLGADLPAAELLTDSPLYVPPQEAYNNLISTPPWKSSSLPDVFASTRSFPAASTDDPDFGLTNQQFNAKYFGSKLPDPSVSSSDGLDPFTTTLTSTPRRVARATLLDPTEYPTYRDVAAAAKAVKEQSSDADSRVFGRYRAVASPANDVAFNSGYDVSTTAQAGNVVGSAVRAPRMAAARAARQAASEAKTDSSGGSAFPWLMSSAIAAPLTAAGLVAITRRGSAKNNRRRVRQPQIYSSTPPAPVDNTMTYVGVGAVVLVGVVFLLTRK